MQEKTTTYYRQKVDEVLEYIQNHLSDDLNIKTLAENSGISFFHFHRIIQAVIGEPIGSYINRAKLDTAVKLIRYSGESFSSIAERIGYNDLSSFSKAFSKEFGLSPQEYRANSNIMLNTHIDYRIGNNGCLTSDLKHKIIVVPDKQVVFIRIKGEYGNTETYEAWDELVGFAMKNRLLTWKPEYLTYYFGDPDVIGFENCMSDFCLVTKKKVAESGRIASKIVAGGKYAVFRFKGPYERLWDVYRAIYGEWLINSNVELRDEPAFEKYLNYSDHIKPENLLTEIYLPIE